MPRLSMGSPLKGMRSPIHGRRSSVGGAYLDENDDQAERAANRQRRKSGVLPGRGSPLKERNGGGAAGHRAVGAAAPMAGAAGAAAAKLSSQQLSTLYSHCIKLSAENKINAKNSWSLSLIDYMQDIVGRDGGADPAAPATNFQMASCTIDAGVKIYSYRVDSVHNETYKVLMGIAANKDKDKKGDGAGSDDEDGAGSDDEDGGKAGRAAARRKAKRVGQATIETKVDNINATRFDLEFDVDPMFKKTSAAFDEGGARGLLLRQLPVDRQSRILFDSQMAPSPLHPPTETNACDAHDATVDLSGLKDSLKTLVANLGTQSAPAPLCPTFVAYLDEQQGAPKATSPTKPPAGAVGRGSAGDDDEDDDDDDDGDDDGDSEQANAVSYAFFGQDAHDPEDILANAFADDAPDYDMEPDELFAAANSSEGSERSRSGLGTTTGSGQSSDQSSVRSRGRPTVAILSEASPAGDDYAYFDAASLRAWAGPVHWKFRSTRVRRGVAAGGAGDGSPSSKGARSTKSGGKPQGIDFLQPCKADLKKALARSRGKASNTLSAAAGKKGAVTTLPKDAQYQVQMLSKLFTRDAHLVIRERTAVDGDADPARDWYDYNNPHDAADYCPEDSQLLHNQLYGDDGDDYDDAPDFDLDMPDDPADAPAGAPAGGFDGEDLVAMPTRANKLKVSFSRRAKQVDVKVLKKTIWATTEPAIGSGPGGDDDDADATAGGEGATLKFSQVVANTPLTEATQEASVPMFFICLLHLANEKGLVITGRDDLSDLSIANGEAAGAC